MKSDLERGRMGAWAYRARRSKYGSAEKAAAAISASGYQVDGAYLRGIEAGHHRPGRELLAVMEAAYESVAPAEEVPVQVATGDAVAAAIDRQTEVLARLADRLERIAAPTAPIVVATPAAVGIQSPWPAFIRLARTARGMTPGDLAVRLGTTARTIERWESGESGPSLQQQGKLLGVLSQADAPAARRQRAAG